jgi:threonine aldolase
MAALGGIMPRTLPVLPDGTFDLDAVQAAVRGNNVHFPKTRLIALENTHGGRGGAPLPKTFMDAVGSIAHARGLIVHVDGARIFNAAAALNTPVDALCENVDSLTFCLSKGLCAPVGSVLVGDKAFISEARRVRKMLGGGLRQAGMLAAAGRVALRDMTERLAEDHNNACTLADGLAQIEAVEVEREKVKTNFVFFSLRPDAKLTATEFKDRLWSEYRIRVSPYPGYERRFRCVLHYWITPERVQTTLGAVKALLA